MPVFRKRPSGRAILDVAAESAEVAGFGTGIFPIHGKHQFYNAAGGNQNEDGEDT